MKPANEIFLDFDTTLSLTPDPKEQLKKTIEFAIIYNDCFSDRVTPYIERAAAQTKAIGYEVGPIICYFIQLYFQGLTKDKKQEPSYLSPLLSLSDMEELVRKDPYWNSWGLAILAYSFWYKGEYTRSFDLVFEAIKNAEKEKSTNIGRTYYTLGIFYFDTNDLEASNTYFIKTLEAYKQYGIIYGIARVMNNLASIAIRQNRTHDAITLLESSQRIYRELGHHAGLSRVLNDLGMIEKTNGHYKKAYPLFQEAINLRQEISHTQGLVTTYTELGETYLLEGNYDQALHDLNEGLRYSREINSKQKCMRLHKLLSDVYKIKQNIPAAFEHHEAFYQLKSDLLSDEATNTIKKLQSSFEKEKAEQEAEIERLRNVELKQANNIIQSQNIELQETIDELTRVKISRKAITLTLIVGVALFFLSEGLLDPIIDNYSQSMWYGLFAKLLIALILKPIESLFEKILLRRVTNKRTKQTLMS